MARGTISKSVVDAFNPTKQEMLWDDREIGFGLLAMPSGTKSYVFQYRLGGRAGKTRRYTIGRHGEWTPDRARKRAKELRAEVTRGIDPMEAERERLAAVEDAKAARLAKERLHRELAFETVAERWLAEYELGHRPQTYAQAKHVADVHLVPALRGKPLPHITRADLQPILDKIPARRKASRLAVYAYASVLFRWAMERGEIADNPVRFMAKPDGPKARDRVLSDDELAAVWSAAVNLRDPYGAFYRLLMLTGQRREEVSGMNWAELDRATSTWTIPGPRAKNGKAHIVPLAPAVVAEFDRLALAVQIASKEEEPDARKWPKSGPVLTTYRKVAIRSYSKAKAELDAAIADARGSAGPLAAWRVHDLRRTLATGLQRLGIRLEVTEAALNHVSGSKAGIVGVYQKHNWADEKREALRSWAAMVAAIAAGHRPEQFVNAAGEADPEAWRGYIRACVDNGGQPVERAPKNVVDIKTAKKSG